MENLNSLFSPEEIIKIAVKVEENGVDFYGQLEKKTTDQAQKAIWCYLKEQEKQHQDIFSQMLSNIKDFVVYEQYGQNEYDAYFKAVASGFIFTQRMMTDKAKELLALNSTDKIIDFAITVEKESIATFSVLLEYIHFAKKHLIEEIIKQEKDHLTQLTQLKAKLN
ncbi:MAG: ferritin family protein [Candidatus Omnitrophota bacterium]